MSKKKPPNARRRDPTPAQIRQTIEEIQAEWSPETLTNTGSTIWRPRARTLPLDSQPQPADLHAGVIACRLDRALTGTGLGDHYGSVHFVSLAGSALAMAASIAASAAVSHVGEKVMAPRTRLILG